jgi:heme/copper-type cytochrome/quinol oxidase subunit 1
MLFFFIPPLFLGLITASVANSFRERPAAHRRLAFAACLLVPSALMALFALAIHAPGVSDVQALEGAGIGALATALATTVYLPV